MAEKKRVSMREQRARYVKQKIHKTALDLFDQRGFDKVKIADICEKANISTGTFYYYFPSKDHILMEYDDSSDSHFEKLASQMKYQTASEFLHKLIQQKIDLVCHRGHELLERGFVADLLHHQESSFNLERKAYGLFRRAVEEGIENGEFRADLDVMEVVSQLRYLVGGFLVHWCLCNGEFDVYKEAEKMLDGYLRVISPE